MTDNLDQLREKAEAFIAASDCLDEIGLGIGGLMVHAPVSGEDYFVWIESTDYEHADTVLALIDRAERAEQAVQRVREVATGEPTAYGWGGAMDTIIRALDGGE